MPPTPAPSISFATPAFNEEPNIEQTVRDAVAVLACYTTDYEVVVVDDGSRDRTAEIVQGLAAENPRVRLVQHPVNQGYGAAVWSGLTAATKDLVVFTDSDGQFDLNVLGRFLERMEGTSADMVIGYRAPRRDAPMRLVNAFGWKLLVSLLFGYVARDVDCAFKLFRREILDRVYVDSRGATFSAEFLVRVRDAGFRIEQINVRHLPRRAGRATGARPEVILRAFKELLRFRLRYRHNGPRVR